MQRELLTSPYSLQGSSNLGHQRAVLLAGLVPEVLRPGGQHDSPAQQQHDVRGVERRDRSQIQPLHQGVRQKAAQDGHETVAHEHRLREGAAQPVLVIPPLRSIELAVGILFKSTEPSLPDSSSR